MMKNYIVRIIALFLLINVGLLCNISPIRAENADRNDRSALGQLLDVLHDKGTIDAQTHAALMREIREDSIKGMPDEKAKIDTNGRFQVTSADGKSMFRFGGRIHLDGAFYDNASDVGFSSGFDARRARMEVQGLQDANWHWKLDYEFAQHSDVQSGFRDAFVRYTVPNTAHAVTVGQFKEFYGLESLNSSNDLAFVERALPSRTFHDIAEASDGRRIGLGLNSNDRENFTFAIGAFARNMSGDSYDQEGDPFAIEGRVTASPVHNSTTAVHAGLSANWMDINNPSFAKLSARPEARIGTSSLVSTGQMTDVESMARYGAELGGIEGPLWSQAEYMVTTMNRGSARSVQFSGWYATVGYILTGEARRYSFEKGTFSNPKISRSFSNGGWGAWELAGRLSGLDLSDQDIQGGEERNFSLGLNWFPNDTYKIMFTWTKVLDVVGGAYDGETPSAFLMRTQFAF